MLKRPSFRSARCLLHQFVRGAYSKYDFESNEWPYFLWKATNSLYFAFHAVSVEQFEEKATSMKFSKDSIPCPSSSPENTIFSCRCLLSCDESPVDRIVEALFIQSA